MKRNPPGGTVQAPALPDRKAATAWTEIPATAGYAALCLPLFLRHSLSQSQTDEGPAVRLPGPSHYASMGQGTASLAIRP